MFENPRRGRQARNFTQNVPKILELKFTLGAPDDNLGSLPRRRSWGFSRLPATSAWEATLGKTWSRGTNSGVNVTHKK